jgi:hypothetical protein
MRKTTKPKKQPHQLSARLQSELATSPIIPVIDNLPRIKHSVNIGDLYAAMGALKRYWEITGRKVVVCQVVGQLASYYSGAEHPTKNSDGRHVCMNDTMWDMVKPLIEEQDYIGAFEKYGGQKIDIDLDVIRGKTFVNMPHGAIQQWIPLAYPDLTFDMSKAWIDVKGECPKRISEQVSRKIIINFTERYRNPVMDYFFLQNYAPDLIFAGTEREQFLFCSRWNLNIPRLEINNFLDLAHALKESRFMIGNQSQCWNLAEAMKTPRVLEICSFADNCQIMVGADSLGYLYQVGAEYAFRVLYNKTFQQGLMAAV